MAQLNPEGSFDTLKDRAAAAVASHFPYEGSTRRLELNRIWVEDSKGIDDIKSQQAAKLKGRSWTVPMKVDASLIDKKTGEVIDRSTVTVAQLPKITRRYSYIVDGKEAQIDNQFRLKSGAYHREDEVGNLQAHWNIEKWEGSRAGRFDIYFDPAKRQFRMPIGTTKDIGLYPVLKAMGTSDGEIERRWGREVYESAIKEYGDDAKQLRSLNKVLAKAGKDQAKDLRSARQAVKTVMEGAKVRKDSTKVTLGKPYERVNGEALLRSSGKLLDISRGDAEQDDRESLVFKDVLAAEDLIEDRLHRSRWDINRRLRRGVNKKETVREALNPAVFNKPIHSLFQTELAQVPEQTNPLEFVSGQFRTTLMGPGGIGDIQVVPEEALAVNPSHLTFLDPIPTPEGEKTGITLQLPLGARKEGRGLKSRAYNRKTGKVEELDPLAFSKATVAFADQVEWKNGKPLPRGETVAVSTSGNSIEMVPYKDVTHVMLSTKAMYSMPTNLVPFLQSDQGNRAMTASRQQEQAVPLIHREAPLVQSVMDDGKTTFEQVMGRLNSHQSPVDGKVVSVKDDLIVVKDKKGTRHDIQIYDNFPLNSDGNHINSTPLVQKGDKVSKGQVVADTNYSRGGNLALGTNLRAAYLPFKGYNFEDGLVISEGAAQKLTSEHMYRPSATVDKNTTLDKRKLLANLPPDALNKEQRDKLDDDAVVLTGMRVEKGDVLIGRLQKEEYTTEQRRLQGLRKSVVKPYRDRTVKWEKDRPGEVVRVVKSPKGVEVHVKTIEPAQVGDKLVGRHGNKGIIAMVVPDHEMPHTPDGRSVEIAMNPAGVPGRINLGQVLETAAGKVARKRGEVYKAENFPNQRVDNKAKVKADLAANGLSEKERLIDPISGKEMGDVLVGDQYIFKLKQQVEKKTSVRSGGVGNPYSVNNTPKGGGAKGGQAVSALGLYGLLAHGAKHNIREMQTLKSDRNDDLWTALQAGESLPPPKPTFTYEKLKGQLNVMGINVEKEGSSLLLRPLTDDQVRNQSAGELEDPGSMFRGKDMRPLKGGLFDEQLTGGTQGTKWTHFELGETMPNPVFEKAIAGLLGINQRDIPKIVAGKQELGGKTGPEAIVDALEQIDVQAELPKAEEALKGARKSKLNAAYKKVRYLRALESAGVSPKDAYTTKAVPVLPPIMRPVTVLDNGSLNTDDINGLYRALHTTNLQLKEFDPGMPTSRKRPLQEGVYDGLKALTLTGADLDSRHYRGVMETIAGDQPKKGFFQDKVISRKQDMSMRGIIIPEDSMGLDEVGLPKKSAMELYRPLVVKELVKGFGYSPLQAQKAIKEGKPVAEKALEVVAEQRPVILKRDPALDKMHMLTFRPKIVGGHAIKIHPLVTGGYGADFDGDTMSVFVPLTHEAVAEARRLLPSKNLYNPSTGKLAQTPGHEAQLGIFQMSRPGRKTGHRFRTGEDALQALKSGKIAHDDIIEVYDPQTKTPMLKAAAPVQTTAGRLILAQAVPSGSEEEARLLKDFNLVLDKKGAKTFLRELAKKDPQQFAETVNRFNQMGNRFTFETGFSFGLDDFDTHRDIRDPLMEKAEKKARELEKQGMSRNEAVVEAYASVIPELDRAGKARMDDTRNNVYEMVRSGARGNWDQFKQITLAPVLVNDTDGKPVPIPIKSSYSEGLSAAEYWASMAGARMGTLAKVSGTSRPGALTKGAVNVAMRQLVVMEDCGTTKGVSMHVDDPEVHDRYLAADASVRGKTFPRGTLLTPEILSTLRNGKTNRVVVRSPLKCRVGDGVCAKCYGVQENGKTHDIGTNLGVIAAQAVGQPAVNLSMKSFHCHFKDLGAFYIKDTDPAPKFLTFEEFFASVSSAVLRDEHGEEVKLVHGWRVWDGPENRWVRVTHVRRHKPTRPLKWVSDGGLGIICQDNHPIAAWKRTGKCRHCGERRLLPLPASLLHKSRDREAGRCTSCGRWQKVPSGGVGGLDFLTPAELEPKQYWLRRDLSPVTEAVAYEALPLNLDPYFAGAYVAEGCLGYRIAGQRGKTKRPYFTTVTQNEGEVRQKIASVLPEGWRESDGRTFRIDDIEVGRQFENWFGRYAWNKGLPSDFLSYPDRWLLSFLCGEIDGDGCVVDPEAGPQRVAVDTTSFKLAQQVVLIAYRFGIPASINPTKEREQTQHQAFRVTLTISESAADLLSESVKVGRITRFAPEREAEGTGLHLISTIKPVLYDENDWVYDSTTETGTFYAGGLKTHNTGGVVSAGGGAKTDDFQRVSQMLSMPEKLRGSATLSGVNGKVSKQDIRKDPAGGWRVTVRGMDKHRKATEREHYIPGNRDLAAPLQEALEGKQVRIAAGQALSSGPVNPRELLDVAGIEKVRNHMVDEMYDAYRKVGPVKRRNMEVVVRAMTNLAEVHDPGDTDYLRGDIVPSSALAQKNEDLAKEGKQPAAHRPILRGISQTPLLMQEDWLARMQFENLKGTVLEGAAQGWASDVHGVHPIPGMVYGAEFGRGTEEKPYAY